MGIDLGRFHICMAHEILHEPDVHAVFQKMRLITMPPAGWMRWGGAEGGLLYRCGGSG